MRLRWNPTPNLQLVSEGSNFVLIFLLHLQLILFKLVNFIPNELHLLNLLRNLTFDLLGTPTLIVELIAKGVENLVQAMVGLPRGRRTEIWVAPMLRCVEHGELYEGNIERRI